MAYTDGNLEILKEPCGSPLLADDAMPSDLPEALVISAGLDNFRFEDEQYAIRMAAMGVKVTVKRFQNTKHGFIIHCTEEWEEGQKFVIETIMQAKLK